MPRAMFFIKIARSYLFTSALCFPLSSLLLPSTFTPCFPLSLPQLPSVLAPASFYSHLCFHLSSPRARSASRHPRFISRRSFSHDFSLPRHTLFGIKPCIASSFPVIWPCFVPRHTFSRAKACIASRVGAVCSIVEACRRVPHAATHPFRHETMYREQFSCHLAMFRAATHTFPHKSLYREQSDVSSPDFQLAIQVFSIKRVCRRQKTHTLNQNATAAHENWPLRVCRKRKTLPLPPFSARHKVFLQKKGVSRIGTVP